MFIGGKRSSMMIIIYLHMKSTDYGIFGSSFLSERRLKEILKKVIGSCVKSHQIILLYQK